MSASSEDFSLAGTWNVDNGLWEFSGGPTEYHVIETGLLGQTAQGRAGYRAIVGQQSYA